MAQSPVVFIIRFRLGQLHDWSTSIVNRSTLTSGALTDLQYLWLEVEETKKSHRWYAFGLELVAACLNRRVFSAVGVDGDRPMYGGTDANFRDRIATNYRKMCSARRSRNAAAGLRRRNERNEI